MGFYLLFTFSTSQVNELQSVTSGFQDTGVYFVAEKNHGLSLVKNDSWDLGLHWIVPKISKLLSCDTVAALNYLYLAFTLISLVLTALGALYFFKSRSHKIIHILFSSIFLILFTSQIELDKHLAAYWVVSFFPLFLFILRSRKKILPLLLLIPLSLMACLSFLISFKLAIVFYISALLLIKLSEQRFFKKIGTLAILFIPLLYSIYWTHNQYMKAIDYIETNTNQNIKVNEALSFGHDFLKGLGQYDNKLGLGKSDELTYQFVASKDQAYSYMSDDYFKSANKIYIDLLLSETAFVIKVYLHRLLEFGVLSLSGKATNWIIGKSLLIIFFIWGMIILTKYFVVQREYRITIPFILMFLLLSLWSIMTGVNLQSCFPSLLFMYCYLSTLGIWDWERVSGDHFPFY